SGGFQEDGKDLIGCAHQTLVVTEEESTRVRRKVQVEGTADTQLGPGASIPRRYEPVIGHQCVAVRRVIPEIKVGDRYHTVGPYIDSRCKCLSRRHCIYLNRGGPCHAAIRGSSQRYAVMLAT